MGIMAPVARFILKEHKRKPIVGRAAFIGRQTIPLTESQAIEMIISEGIVVRDTKAQIDRDTRQGVGHNFIDEVTFFNLFTNLDITFIDVTDYEGAQIVHDMCQTLPNELKNGFDFVWNGSCLDNIFDAAAAQRNSCELLAPGGRIVTMEMANSHYGSYCGFSQGWFYDYYAINNFLRAEVYSCVFKSGRLWNGPFKAYRPREEISSGDTFPLASSKYPVITLAIATKGLDSSTHLSPIQAQYRPDNSLYAETYKKFNSNPQLLQPVTSKWFKNKKVDGFVEVSLLLGARGGFIRRPRYLRIILHPVSALGNLLARKWRL